MNKKHFIALADTIRKENRYATECGQPVPFTESTIKALALFCKSQNPAFDR